MELFLLSTRRKVQLASILNRLVGFGRSALRKPMQGQFRRGGLNWQLNLNEGIDFAIWLAGGFEKRLQATYVGLIAPGSCVLDLGANIGAHTLPLARLVGPQGRVIAVEATEYACEKLKANLELNRELVPRVRLIHALLDDGGSTSHAPTHLHSSWPLNADADTHPVLCGALKTVGAARVVSLDTLIQELSPSPISWIKLDVDGHEFTVLQGARNTLAAHRPNILLELAPYCHVETPGQFEALIKLLHDIGYDLYNAETMRPLPRALDELHKVIPPNGSINALAKIGRR